MKRRTKALVYILSFVLSFVVSAVVRMRILGSAPARMFQVDWNGIICKDLRYGDSASETYDLYLPERLDKSKAQHLIVYIHGGSFNSGSKEDGTPWCRYFASKGYLTASLNYTLQKHDEDATLGKMGQEIENAVAAISDYTKTAGIQLADMAVCGVSAGGTLAMNFAYRGRSEIPVRFVFQLAAPTYFAADEWELLKKVDGLESDDEFYRMMIGDDYSEENLQEEINSISPASLVDEDSVPTLLGYGLIDHCVPLTQKYYLLDSLKKYNVPCDYIEFPHSNHGMYNDPDKLQNFIDLSLEYCSRYFLKHTETKIG